MIKEKKNKKTWLEKWGVILISAAVGLVIGVSSAVFFPQQEMGTSLYMIVLMGVSFILSYLVHVPIHEAGHLLFGLLTGYTFISYRVGNFTVLKRDGKLKTARMGIPGTAGQCLMRPPEYQNGNYPYVLYNLGGAVVNTAAALAAFWMMGSGLHWSVNALLAGFGLAGLFSAVTNGLPWKIGGMPTDGFNILSIKRDADAKRAFWIQLEANARLSEGVRPKELPEEWFASTETDWSNPLKTSVQLLEFNVYLDQLDFEGARASLNELVPHMDEFVPLYRNELNAERLFLELVEKNDPDMVQSMYDEELQTYIKTTQAWPNKKRLMMAYEGFHRQDTKKAMEQYSELIRSLSSYPIKGEAEMERMLADWLKERISLKRGKADE